jgi:hypothetical protein
MSRLPFHLATRDRAVIDTPQIDGAPKPKLLDQVRSILRVNHYSLRTEEAYLQWIRRFIYFHGKRHPAEMGSPLKLRVES